MKRNPALALYVVLVFASGVLVGVLGQRFYQSRTVSAQTGRPGNRAEEFRRKLMSELQSRLHLSHDQENAVNKALDITRDRLHLLQQRNAPEIKVIIDDEHNSIRSILDDQQKVEYQKMLDERERRRKQQQQPAK